MRETNNLKLNLLDEDDFVDITPINENTEKLDSEVTGAKVLLGQLGQETNAALAALTAKNSEQDTLIAELDENISALEQSAATKQSGFYSAQHSHSGTVHSLSVQDPPASGVYSVRFTATASFAEGDTLKLNGTPLPAVLTNGEALPDKLFTEGAVVCAEIGGGRAFFRAGGLGYNDELPVQPRYGVNIGVESGVATVLPEAVDRAHAGNLFVYKRGETAPSSPKDGTVVDLGKAAAIDITGLENDVKYTGRLFAYNSKKQLQTIYNERSFYPSDYAPGNYAVQLTENISPSYNHLVKYSDTGATEWTRLISDFIPGNSYTSTTTGCMGFSNKGELLLYRKPTETSSGNKQYTFSVTAVSPSGEGVVKRPTVAFSSPASVPMLNYGVDGYIYVTTWMTLDVYAGRATITIHKLNMDLELISSMDVKPYTKWMDNGPEQSWEVVDYQGRIYRPKEGKTTNALVRLSDAGDVEMEIEFPDGSTLNGPLVFSAKGDGFVANLSSPNIYYYAMDGTLLNTFNSLELFTDGTNYRYGGVHYRGTENVLISGIAYISGQSRRVDVCLVSITKDGIEKKISWSFNGPGNYAPLIKGMNLFKNDYNSSIFVDNSMSNDKKVHAVGAGGARIFSIPRGALHAHY